MNTKHRALTRCPLSFAFLLLATGSAHAFSGGVPSTALGPSGCNQCHTGGLVPTVKLAGPTEVEPGSTHEYQLSIVVRGDQNHGGLSAAVSDGELSLGGSFAAETRTINGGAGEEITHSEPKLTDVWNQIEFTFLWTAPSSFSSMTLNVWGNAVDHDGTAGGDQASFASLEVVPAGSVPEEDPCSVDLLPRTPFPVADPATQKCQLAIAKGGLAYTKGVLKVMQKCLQDFHRWGLTGEPYPVCVGSGGTPPSDQETAERFSVAERNALNFIDTQCTDAMVAELGLCADAVGAFKGCFATDHRAAVEALLRWEFGNLRQTDEVEVRKCQRVIAKEAAKYVTIEQKAMQKCLTKWNKSPTEDEAADVCLGALVAGEFIPPTDPQTAEAIAQAERKMNAKILAACSEEEVAELDTCTGRVDGLGECLVCTHRAGSYQAMSADYGGGIQAAP
jgi:hypothetical protein